MDRNAYLRELGLSEGAQREDLILAYRRLMIQWHPERAKTSDSLESRRRNSATVAAFSALEKSCPGGYPRTRQAQTADIASMYGPPRFQNTSFEATSLSFLPARSVTEL